MVNLVDQSTKPLKTTKKLFGLNEFNCKTAFDYYLARNSHKHKAI